ncbi:hypothetical protein [Streptomyces griseus]|uniref:hypothetical protein n=1 Tax=Streptomyces griseus TaxID=1911 RepID=UPI003808438F
MNARKTIFQPLRTEIFKKQIDALAAALELFVGKSHMDLGDDFDLKFAELANFSKMYDRYLLYAFKMRRPEESLEYRVELCPVSWVKEEYLMLNMADKATGSEPAKLKVLDEWAYEHYDISVPRKYLEREAEFRAVLDNPLLPTSIAALIEAYLDTMRQTLSAVAPVLEECAKEMPERYESLDDIKNVRFDWIQNRLNENRRESISSLSESAKVIVEEIRSYFDSDNLLPSGSKRKL